MAQRRGGYASSSAPMKPLDPALRQLVDADDRDVLWLLRHYELATGTKVSTWWLAWARSSPSEPIIVPPRGLTAKSTRDRLDADVQRWHEVDGW